MGVIDDVVLNLYAGFYSGAASWLALRTSTLCPVWLHAFDSILPWLAAGVFALSLAAPVVTLLEHQFAIKQEGKRNESAGGLPLSERVVRFSRLTTTRESKEEVQNTLIPSSLSETELFRVNGLIFIGSLGCVFV